MTKEPSTCRDCGAAIEWMTTWPGNRSVPLDPEPAPDGKWVKIEVQGARKKLMRARCLKLNEETELDRYNTHYKTCPYRRDGVRIRKTIYLAARYSRREELVLYRAILTKFGHTVTSRWLNGNHQISDDGLSAEAAEEERIRFAEEDWEDLTDAEVVVSFTEPPRATNSRGGRHVEFGAAMALGKRVIVVGPRENVFHCRRIVEWYPDWEWFDQECSLMRKETTNQ